MSAETTPNPEKQLTTIAQSNGVRFLPQNLEQAKDLAKVLAASSLIPKEFQGNAANTLIAIMKGAELGLTPAQSLGNIMVVNGRPAVWGDVVIGMCESSGLLEWWEDKWDEATKTATFTVKRKGKPKPISRTFSIDEAKTAGLLGKDTWQKYPKRMCFNRARAFALRDVFADRLSGFGIIEELQDTIIDVTPNRPVTTEEAAQVRDAFVQPVKEAEVVPPVESKPEPAPEIKAPPKKEPPRAATQRSIFK